MVWGCFAGSALGDICKIEGRLVKEGYKTILKEHAIPSGTRIVGREFVFQQDNDPKHTSKLCKDYLDQMKRLKKRIKLWFGLLNHRT